jgi:VIT1/CCC1 family predicted Fe2+/Mn2+ transporter
MKKYPFQALGFAYVIVGLLMSFPFFYGLSSPGITLTVAGLILLVTVEIEARREDRQAS